MAGTRLRIFLAALSASPVLSTCGYGTSLQPRAEVGVEVDTFGYTGLLGPVNWVGLDPVANAICGVGTRQSPIDLDSNALDVLEGSSVALEIPDMLDGAALENLGTTVEVVAQGGTLSLGDGQEFRLAQFHFHLPSEHLDNGTSRAMEMHMVFEGEDGQVAVMAAFIDVEGAGDGEVVGAPVPEGVVIEEEEGEEDDEDDDESDSALDKRFGVSRRQAAGSVLEAVFSVVQDVSQPGSSTTTPPLVMSDLVNTYSGSLTTPPCTEGVTWLVSSQVLPITQRSFASVRGVLGFNSRFPQTELGQENLLQVVARSAAQAGAGVAPEAVIPGVGVDGQEEASLASNMEAVLATYRPIPVPP
ncbi:related to carbonic anhydrase [Cephalotrichum gorgonifer]|uniref:carbonic anhydrase n=1 Tax=Cephalotrichum gorgonifer TaxID=2041049 RepID=A0AAE8MT59_9PEZI|nr:related to carbonic anhydrase [Cephalotrichum gorgonifer]